MSPLRWGVRDSIIGCQFLIFESPEWPCLENYLPLPDIPTSKQILHFSDRWFLSLLVILMLFLVSWFWWLLPISLCVSRCSNQRVFLCPNFPASATAFSYTAASCTSPLGMCSTFQPCKAAPPGAKKGGFLVIPHGNLGLVVWKYRASP